MGKPENSHTISKHRLPYNDPSAPPPESADGEVDLDALLADSMQQFLDQKHLEKGKKALSSAWLRTGEREELQTQVNAIQNRREWRAVAVVAYFHQQLCLACGRIHPHFAGLYQEQEHTTLQASTRWVPATDHTMIDNLPRKAKIVQHSADMCWECSESLGWPAISPLQPDEKEPHHATWTPHKDSQKCANEYQPARRFGGKA